MASTVDTIGGFIKVPNIDGASIFGFLTWVVVFIIFCVIVGIGAFLIIRRLKFNKKVVIFEKVNGVFQPVSKDRAMFIKHGKAGDTVFYFRKMKRYQPNPTYQTGKNTYWFWLREDNELINFSPGDFDEQSRELGAKFLDKEMRYARTSLQETFKERYVKPSFMAQYGTFIFNIVAYAIIGVFLYLIVGELIKAIGSVEHLVESASAVVDSSKELLTAMDNINSGSSSGIVRGAS